MKKLSAPVAVSLCLMLVLLSFAACGGKGETPIEETTANETPAAQTDSVSESPKFDEVSIGDYISFGRYEQNNVIEDGREDISWLVLAKEDNKILIISEYALDRKNYHDTDEDVTWETCDLRKWLNKDFLEEAFTESEQKRIAETSLENKENSTYKTDGGNATVDRIFAFSEEECYIYFPEGAAYEKALFTAPTDYAVAKGAYRGGVGDLDTDTKLGVWWLRTPGAFPDMAMCVIVGVVKSDGAPVDDFWEGEDGEKMPWGGSVRPAMWITAG